MLKDLLGSSTAEKTLLFLIAQGEGYSAEISEAFGISNTQVRRTLERFEESDILVAVNKGKTRVYSLNMRWFLAKELESMLKKALEAIPLDEQESYFLGKRKKPRKKNKP